MQELTPLWVPDILGGDFEQATLTMPNDYEGVVESTLVRLKALVPTTKAVLYVHGFNDYFFQAEMASKFIAEGYNFYALDLRKCGRSYRPYQAIGNMRSVKECYPDLDTALAVIKAENNDYIVLCGHSMGGLITSAYVAEGKMRQYINAMWLNSPFFDIRLKSKLQKFEVMCVVRLAALFPNILVSTGGAHVYGKALHKDYKGEWDYKLEWKLLTPPAMNISWLRAIYKAQKKIKHGLNIQCPILVMCSNKSIRTRVWSDDIQSTDIILDVDSMVYYAKGLGKKVSIIRVDNAMHDLVLSKKAVRESAYSSLFGWLSKLA